MPPARQQVEPTSQVRADLPDVEHSRSRRGELDRERKSVQLGAQDFDRRKGFAVTHERSARSPASIDEQGHRVAAGPERKR